MLLNSDKPPQRPYLDQNSSTQLYTHRAPRIRRLITLKVALIFLADIMQTGFLFAYLYRSLIKFYGEFTEFF